MTGKAQIRQWFATENKAFMPQNHWESDTPSYKIKATVNGDKGTLYFECHYIDAKTRQVVAYVGVDHNVQKINGKWLIVDSAAATDDAEPEAGRPMAQPEVRRSAARPSGRRSPDETGSCGAVARAPANVRTKLLVAFLVIAALLVLVGVLGLRFLGQANARVERLGTLQLRSATYQALADALRTSCASCSVCAPAARPA